MTERESFRKQKYGPRAARLHKKNSRSLLASLFNSRIVGHARSPPQRRSHEAANELADITKTLAQRDAPPLLLFAPSIFEYYTRIHAPLSTSRNLRGLDLIPSCFDSFFVSLVDPCILEKRLEKRV